MASTSIGPSVRRRRLIREIRRLREAAGLTQEQVAKEMDWSLSKVIRIETGRSGITRNDLRAMLELYGDTDRDRVAELVEMARKSKERGWWSPYKDRLPSEYTDYIGFESEATTLRFFEPVMIHGLLQTEEYARAVVREAALREFTDDEVDARVEVRMTRQRILDGDKPPRVWVVLGEAALRQRVGGPEVMRRQLLRLAGRADRPRVRLQVLPFRVGAYPGMTGPFTVLGFPGPSDADIVYLEGAVGDLYLEEPQEIQRYSLMHEHLRAMALGPDESAALIARIAAEMT